MGLKPLIKVILLVSFGCVSLFVFAANAKQQKVFRVGVEAIPFLPFSEYKNGQYEGVFKDILTEFAQHSGLQLEFVPFPVERLYAEFLSGKLDFKIPDNPRWKKAIKDERGLKIVYSEPVLEFIDGLLVKAPLRGLEEVMTIGTVAGFTPWVYHHAINNKTIKLSENPSIEGLLQQALLGRIDGAYINVSVGAYYLRRQFKKERGLVFADNLPFTKDTYHMATIKHAGVIKQFNAYLRSNPPQLVRARKALGLESSHKLTSQGP